MVLDYIETTSDYSYSVVGAHQQFHVLKFQNNVFSLLQTFKIQRTRHIPKPSITDDHEYIIFGDKYAVFFIQFYVFNDAKGEF